MAAPESERNLTKSNLGKFLRDIFNDFNFYRDFNVVVLLIGIIVKVTAWTVFVIIV